MNVPIQFHACSQYSLAPRNKLTYLSAFQELSDCSMLYNCNPLTSMHSVIKVVLNVKFVHFIPFQNPFPELYSGAKWKRQGNSRSSYCKPTRNAWRTGSNFEGDRINVPDINSKIPCSLDLKVWYTAFEWVVLYPLISKSE